MEAKHRPKGLTRDTERTEAIPGAYLPSEAATLRKDLEKLLTPYGFRTPRQRAPWLRHRHRPAINPSAEAIHGVVSQAARIGCGGWSSGSSGEELR
jgi:hypothetical protein